VIECVSFSLQFLSSELRGGLNKPNSKVKNCKHCTKPRATLCVFSHANIETTISKGVKLNESVAFLFFMLLNQSSTELVFFHWFRCNSLVILELILSRICLPIFPISGLDGFIILQVGVVSKLFL